MDNATIATRLGALTAVLRLLAITAQSYHWRTSGQSYYEDHQLFERVYNDVNAMVDPLAERTIGLTGRGEVFSPAAQWTAMGAILEHTLLSDDFPAALLQFSVTTLQDIHKVLEGLEQAGALTDGLENLLQGFADTIEEHVYLLRQRIGAPPLERAQLMGA